MSFPAYVISEPRLHDFFSALSLPPVNLKNKEECKVLEVVRGKSKLLISVVRSFDFEGYVEIKWRLKTGWFGSSKELESLLKGALSKAEAVPIESFVQSRAAQL